MTFLSLEKAANYQLSTKMYLNYYGFQILPGNGNLGQLKREPVEA
jgi:hypothetical protein